MFKFGRFHWVYRSGPPSKSAICCLERRSFCAGFALTTRGQNTASKAATRDEIGAKLDLPLDDFHDSVVLVFNGAHLVRRCVAYVFGIPGCNPLHIFGFLSSQCSRNELG